MANPNSEDATPLEPSLPPTTAGAQLAARVHAQGVNDTRVLQALRRVPRPRFLPADVRDQAYADRAVPIGLEQTISQPYMVGIMTQELGLRGKERVLEIGTGSGYQTAILSILCRKVYTIERHRLLSLRARSVLDGLGLTNIHYQIGDGTVGWPLPSDPPFDRILVTAASPTIPPTLIAQLSEAGRLVAPIGDAELQHLTIVEKVQGQPHITATIPCRFVKLIGAQGWPTDNEF